MTLQATKRATRFLGASLLAMALTAGLAASAALAVESQSVTFEGAAFVNKGLVGVGRVPADAKDKLGDTLGGIGSGMVADVSSWKRDGDKYTGVFYMLPDRGWNTEGSVDYPGRLQKFSVELTPYGGTDVAPQTQLKLTYDDSIVMHEAGGTQHTGLDPTEVRKAANGFPDLPAANGKISLDDAGVVRLADGNF